MSMQDPISDMLTRIRNAQAVGKSNVKMPASNLKIAIAKVLQGEGYINSYEKIAENNKPSLVIELKTFQGKPVIRELVRVSKPGVRTYKKLKNLPKVLDGLGVVIVSTSQGVMTDKTARELGIGGELLCYVS